MYSRVHSFPRLTSPLFIPSLSIKCLPIYLTGLADENESVRDAALSAGHVLVEHYATTYVHFQLNAYGVDTSHNAWLSVLYTYY